MGFDRGSDKIVHFIHTVYSKRLYTDTLIGTKTTTTTVEQQERHKKDSFKIRQRGAAL